MTPTKAATNGNLSKLRTSNRINNLQNFQNSFYCAAHDFLVFLNLMLTALKNTIHNKKKNIVKNTLSSGNPFGSNPPQQWHRRMMVNMQKRDLTLVFLQYKQDGVHQFNNF